MAVLWLSAALAAIAFSLASTVRGELERASTQLDGTRAYYLAAGGLERALLYMQWGPRFQASGRLLAVLLAGDHAAALHLSHRGSRSSRFCRSPPG